MKLSNKNHKGSALFTVVSVMMILMILVMGTFILVSAAHQKAMTNYYNNQSYVTAKNIIDTFVTELAGSTGEPLRQKLIGINNSGTMKGGMQYADSSGTPLRPISEGTFTGSTSIDTDPNNPYCYVDVKVTMPDDGIAGINGEYGLGKIVNQYNTTDPSTIRIHRIDLTTFKVTATVETGIDNSKSIRTVSEIITLTPNSIPNMFDSALTATSGQSFLFQEAQLYGGFVNVGSNSPKFNSNTSRYIGNMYSQAELNNTVDQSFISYLGTSKVTLNGVTQNKADYIQSPNGIHFNKKVEIYNVADVTADDKPNPYIYSSNPSKNIKIYDQSGGKSIVIGQPSTPPVSVKQIDIYSEGNVEIDNATVYGDIYAKGTVKIGNDAVINGNIFSDKIPIINGTHNGITGTLAGVTFPKPYNANTYSQVSVFLGNHYNKVSDGVTYPIKNCFDLGNTTLLAEKKPDPMTGNINNINVDINKSTPGIANTIVKDTKKVGNNETKVYSGYIDLNNKTTESGVDIINFEVEENEDYFIEIRNVPSEFKNFRIYVNPAGTATKDTMGNVYVYIDRSANGATQNVFMGLQNDLYITDNSLNHLFGTNSVSPESPSHFFLLVDGAGKFKKEGDKFLVYGYVYAPSVIFDMDGATDFKSSNFYDKGNLLATPSVTVDGVSYTNKYNLGSKSTPMFIGSCIGASTEIRGSNSSIFIPPGPNIFDVDSKAGLDSYTWNASIMDNH